MDKEGSLPNEAELCEWLMNLHQIDETDLRYVVTAILNHHGAKLCDALVASDINSLTSSIILEEIVKSSQLSLLTNTLHQHLSLKGVSSSLTEIGRKIVHVLTSKESELCVCDTLLDLITVSLATMEQDCSLVIENVFDLLKRCPTSNQFTLLTQIAQKIPLVEPFLLLTHIQSDEELFCLIDHSPICEYVIRFVFLFVQSHSHSIIGHYLPQISTIPIEVEESEFVEWVSKHQFFALMDRKEVFATFTE